MPYPMAKISSAFQEWLKTKSTMPTPADILAILNWDPSPKSNRPEYRILPPEEKHPCYIDLSDADKAKIDEALEKAKAVLEDAKPDKKKAKPLVNHFARMPIEAQQAVHKKWVESVKSRQTETLSDWE